MMAQAEGWAALALWAGQHGLALYVGSLLLLLMGTGLAGCRARQTGRHTLAIGLAVMALSAGVFSAVAWQLGRSSSLGAADALFLQALRPAVSPAARQFFAGLTHAADTATLTALCSAGAIALLLHRQHLLAAAWVLAIAGNGLLNTSLKQAFGRLRPVQWADDLAAPGLSFPSGHSSGAVVAYGMAAYLALRLLPPRWHLPALLLAVALAFSVAASRLVLQVHFVSDVIAGLASGSSWLALCITVLAVVHPARLTRHAPAPAPAPP